MNRKIKKNKFGCKIKIKKVGRQKINVTVDYPNSTKIYLICGDALIYTLSFLVIYPSNCHFYKCQPNTQLFHYTLLTKLHFFIMHFYKKLNQTHPTSDPIPQSTLPTLATPTSSPANLPTIPIDPNPLPIVLVNQHPMQIKSKSGISKPKL